MLKASLKPLFSHYWTMPMTQFFDDILWEQVLYFSLHLFVFMHLFSVQDTDDCSEDYWCLSVRRSRVGDLKCWVDYEILSKYSTYNCLRFIPSLVPIKCWIFTYHERVHGDGFCLGFHLITWILYVRYFRWGAPWAKRCLEDCMFYRRLAVLLL